MKSPMPQSHVVCPVSTTQRVNGMTNACLSCCFKSLGSRLQANAPLLSQVAWFHVRSSVPCVIGRNETGLQAIFMVPRILQEMNLIRIPLCIRGDLYLRAILHFPVRWCPCGKMTSRTCHGKRDKLILDRHAQVTVRVCGVVTK